MSTPVAKDEAHVLPSANAAAANENSLTLNAKKKPQRHRRPPKRPFSIGHSSHKTILPSESKKQLLDSASYTAPLFLIHPIFISLRGLLDLCLHLHENLRVRDRHLYHMSAADLFYVSLLYAITKILRCDAASGFVDPELSVLELTFSNVKFPSVIADYLDSIGKYTMSNGLTVAPSLRWLNWNGSQFIEPMPSYIKRHFLHPALCLESSYLPQWYICSTADLHIPSVQEDYITSERWCLIPGIIEKYQSLVPRMTKSVDMRVPTPSCDGQSNIVVSRRTLQIDSVCGMAPEVLTDEAARIGAVFGWNCYEEKNGWPGDRAILSPWTAGVMFSLSNASASLVQTKMKLFASV